MLTENEEFMIEEDKVRFRVKALEEELKHTCQAKDDD